MHTCTYRHACLIVILGSLNVLFSKHLFDFAHLSIHVVVICFFQLEIGIPTVSLVYLQDNQKYVHTYGINIRGKKQIIHKHIQWHTKNH